MPTTASRRRGASPNPEDLAGMGRAAPAAGRLQKAPTVDPVLAAGSQSARPDSGPKRASASAGKAKVGFYQIPADTARARAAYEWTRKQEGYRSFSDFVAAAVMREVQRLEGEYHDGQPWTAIEPGELPVGRPLDD